MYETLQVVESLFNAGSLDECFAYIKQVDHQCQNLRLEYEKYAAPNHVQKHWKKYVAAATLAGVGNCNRFICRESRNLLTKTYNLNYLRKIGVSLFKI